MPCRVRDVAAAGANPAVAAAAAAVEVPPVREILLLFAHANVCACVILWPLDDSNRAGHIVLPAERCQNNRQCLPTLEDPEFMAPPRTALISQKIAKRTF